MITTEKNFDSLLGRSDGRYFGDVFRSFYTHITKLEVVEDEIHGELSVIYIGPSRPRDEPPHIGSIEYLALALRIATYGLNQLGKINIADTNRTFLRSYTISLRDSLPIGKYPFRCRMLRSAMDYNSIQGSASLFEIQMGSNVALIEVDHRGGIRYGTLPKKETIDWHFEQLHSVGYKSTALQIEIGDMDVALKKISARVTSRYLFEENSLHGIGSSRDALLSTDATRVFGQLMQVLLFEIVGTDRFSCNNIWLRKMELKSERPLFTGNAEANIIFDQIREVRKNGQQWQLIKLSGTVGNFTGQFEVAHLIA